MENKRSDNYARVNRHYGSVSIRFRILDMLRRAGKDPGNLTRDDLASFDEFHPGGRSSTRDLARLANLSAGMKILDIGSGVGGPARTLAVEYGCMVVGVDLTEEFFLAAEMLTGLVGLSDRVSFRHADALDLPFEGGEFDAAWSQYTLMNIPDLPRAFREVFRVLRPGAIFAIETILAGGSPGELHYPLFWAATPELTYLTTPPEMRENLSKAGFVEEVWEDFTQQVLERSRAGVSPAGQADLAAGLGRDVIVPDDVERKLENTRRNYEGGLIRSVRLVTRKPASTPT